jgi:hypothetical protein
MAGNLNPSFTGFDMDIFVWMFPRSNNNKEREERCHYESLLISIHEICNGFLCPFSKGLLDHFAQDLIY